MSEAAELLRATCERLVRAEAGVRVLRTIAWEPAERERFLGGGAHTLPRPSYAAPDVGPVLEAVREARRGLDPGLPGAGWLLRAADGIERGAAMLAAVGTPGFHTHSRELYGSPRVSLIAGSISPLDLARALDESLAGLDRQDLVAEVEGPIGAEELAERLRHAARARFGAAAPVVEVVEGLASKAIAGPRRVRVRGGATFSDLDVAQLVEHELGIHVATALAGRSQTALPLLGAGHPGTTRTQEGLAVLAEVLTRAADPARLRRLAARVIGIDMAERGADFVELFQFYRARSERPEDAYEDARRVVRGGLVEGGAPFTKDVVYLDGLLRVQNFLRAAVELGRVDLVRLLFAGKVALADVPDLAELRAAGLLAAPRYLPDWAVDLRPLVATLALSGFLYRIDLPVVRAHYEHDLARAPRAEDGAA